VRHVDFNRSNPVALTAVSSVNKRSFREMEDGSGAVSVAFMAGS